MDIRDMEFQFTKAIAPVLAGKLPFDATQAQVDQVTHTTRMVVLGLMNDMLGTKFKAAQDAPGTALKCAECSAPLPGVKCVWEGRSVCVRCMGILERKRASEAYADGLTQTGNSQVKLTMEQPVAVAQAEALVAECEELLKEAGK